MYLTAAKKWTYDARGRQTMVRREAVLYMTGKEIPMKVLDSKFVKDFIKMADAG